MSNFGLMTSDLQLLTMGKLLPADLQSLLNRAQREEVEAYPWSFLFTNTVVNSIAVLNAGTVAVTTNSATVIGTGTAFPALALLPPVRAFIHIGTSNIAIPIASVSGPNNLTMSSPWAGAALPSTAYNIIIPVYSVVGFIEVYAIRQILELTKRSREYINRVDPARLAIGGNPSIEWCPWGFDSSGNIQIEIWPPPSAAVPYLIEGKIGAATMALPTDLPQVPTSVISNKALSMACDSLLASSGNDKWGTLSDKYYGIYKEELEKAQTADVARQNLRPDGVRNNPGLDFYASHDTTVIR